jgi:prepilin-type N-terminal cleavage/methylation domain-containing protein
MKSQLKNAQSGYSLIELSIALAIIGIVIAGSIIGVQSILRANNVNKTISQTNNAVNKIVAKLARDNTYNNANTANLSAANMNIWEDDSIVRPAAGAAAQVNHPFGNNVYVTPLGGAVGQFEIDPGQAYAYTLTGIPVAACSDLAVGLEGLGVGLSITNQAPPAAGPQNGVIPATIIKQPGIPFNSANAAAACNGAVQTATISLLVHRR